MKFGKIALAFALPLILLQRVSAHCPLCTVGAAAAAGGALWLGVSKVVVALFIGAFAVSMGWWLGRMVKKKYIPFQRTLIIIASFLLTVLPILPIMKAISPFYLNLYGGYGSLLNRTYIIDVSLIASIAGGLLVSISPSISKKLTNLMRGKKIPFQGIIITFALLLISGLIVQFAL